MKTNTEASNKLRIEWQHLTFCDRGIGAAQREKLILPRVGAEDCQEVVTEDIWISWVKGEMGKI